MRSRRTRVGQRTRVASALKHFNPEPQQDIARFARTYFREFFSVLPRPTVIVLDSFQEARTTPELRSAFAHALEEVPDGITVIAISRSEPPHEFARLGASRRVARIEPSALACTPDEAEAMLAGQDADTAREFLRAGRAARALGRFEDANGFFRDAAALAPADAEINTAWGDLFLEKYNRTEAVRSYDAALKEDENYAPAIVGMASGLAEDNPPQALVFAERALKLNPRDTAAMLIMAATTFHAAGLSDIGTIEEAHKTLQPLLGSAASTIFAISLLAAGLSSATVGTMAGQVVMQGFIRRSIPLWLRRAITMLPTLIIIGVGADPTQTLVISQVVLSFGIPFALVPLVMFTSNRKIMGDVLVNRKFTTVIATGIAALRNGVRRTSAPSAPRRRAR